MNSYTISKAGLKYNGKPITNMKKHRAQRLPHFELPADPGPGPVDKERTAKKLKPRFKVGDVVQLRRGKVVVEVQSADDGEYVVVDKLTYQPEIISWQWLDANAK